MLAELDVVVFLKSHDSLERTAQRVFGALRSSYEPVQLSDEEEEPPDVDREPESAADDANFNPAVESNDQVQVAPNAYQSSGLGFRALLFSNSGTDGDPEFEAYQFGLEITSGFWCVELDTLDLEGPLSEYFARQLAFDLNIETATEILLETTEEAEIFEVRAYRRNPQYRLDQAPTTPKVFVVEARQYEQGFEEEPGWEEEAEQPDEDASVPGEGEALAPIEE